MFKVLCFLFLDAMMIYALTLFEQFSGYIILLVLIVIWLTWELVMAFKEWFGK